jgi:colanic acid/amylovoran biosynthesis protein WcaK/AmsJ
MSLTVTGNAFDLAETWRANAVIGQQTSSVLMGSEPVNVCILGGGYGTSNMGVHALTSGTVTALLNAFPQARPWLMDYDDFPAQYEVRAGNKRVPVPMVNLRFSKKVWLANNIAWLLGLALLGRIIPFQAFRRMCLARNHFLHKIQESDFVVSLAGGDSFSDIYGQARLWYVLLPQVLALAMNRPLVLLPQTIGPFKTARGRWLARGILRRARWICARDTESLNEVGRLLRHKPRNATFAYDMAFALEPLPPARQVKDLVGDLRQRGGLVGLNVSGLLYCGGYTGKNEFGLRSNYQELVEKLIRFFVERQGCQVLLVPHVLGGAEDAESDGAACERIAAALGPGCQGRLHALRSPLNHNEVKWVIGQCDFFLGSRMHACIAAVSQAVPALGLAYSRKFAGVFGSMGVDELVVDLTQHELKSVLELVERRFQQRHELKQKLLVVAPKLKASVLDLFQSIGRVVAMGSNGA